jgi:hypothetical protein
MKKETSKVDSRENQIFSIIVPDGGGFQHANVFIVKTCVTCMGLWGGKEYALEGGEGGQVACEKRGR